MKTTVYDWELHQGAAVDLLIPVTGLPTTGVGVRCHIRDSVDAVAPRLILAHDNPVNRRVTVSAEGIRIQIGATVTGGLQMAQPRNLWGYDVEVYSLTDADDVLKPRAGTIYAYREWTRESDTVAMPPLASGDGRYLRIDGDQGLTPEQQAWAQHNANTGPGGPGGTSDHGALAGLADDDHPQSQTAAVQEWRNSSGTVRGSYSVKGGLYIPALGYDATNREFLRGEYGATTAFISLYAAQANGGMVGMFQASANEFVQISTNLGASYSDPAGFGLRAYSTSAFPLILKATSTQSGGQGVLVMAGHSNTADASRIAWFKHAGAVNTGFVAFNSAYPVGWSADGISSLTAAPDTALVRAAAAVVGVTNGSTGGGALEFTAMTAPSAPSAGKGRAWFEDNGSGKLRYMVRFPSGAAQQIAIEP